MNRIRSSLRRPFTVIVAVVALCLGGWMAISRMARDVFVAQPYGGMDPPQMEGYLTYYYEYRTACARCLRRWRWRWVLQW